MQPCRPVVCGCEFQTANLGWSLPFRPWALRQNAYKFRCHGLEHKQNVGFSEKEASKAGAGVKNTHERGRCWSRRKENRVRMMGSRKVLDLIVVGAALGKGVLRKVTFVSR